MLKIQKEDNGSGFGVIFVTTHTAATTPRNSIFTLSLLKIRAVFLWFPMFASIFLGDEKQYQQTVFTIVNQTHRKA